MANYDAQVLPDSTPAPDVISCLVSRRAAALVYGENTLTEQIVRRTPPPPVRGQLFPRAVNVVETANSIA